MTRTAKRYPSTTWIDLRLYCEMLAIEHGLLIEVSIEMTTTSRQDLRATVKFYEAAQAWANRQTLKTACGPVSTKPDAQAGAIMHLVNMAYIAYSQDAWNWTLIDRKREASPLKPEWATSADLKD